MEQWGRGGGQGGDKKRLDTNYGMRAVTRETTRLLQYFLCDKLQTI